MSINRSSGMDAASGPIVWAGIIVANCLLLFLFQKILFLVVPLLIALILYYFLKPPMQRLVLGGMSRETAGAVVMSGFVLIAAISVVLVLPWMATQSLHWEESVSRYISGGSALLKNTLVALEDRFGWLAKAHFSDQVAWNVAAFTEDFAQKYLAQFILTFATWLPSVLLAPFLVYFFLCDGQRFKRFLGRAVPNAYFERTLYLLHEVDRTSRAYFRGLLSLTIIEAGQMSAGLWIIGMPAPIALGLITAVLAWVPYVGPMLGAVIVVLVAATDFSSEPWVAYATIALFLSVRLLSDFVFLPLTIGRSLHIHPVVAVLMLFVGAAVAGAAGLMLALPLLGVVMVIGETVGTIVTDPRLRARHEHARRLRGRRANADLV